MEKGSKGPIVTFVLGLIAMWAGDTLLPGAGLQMIVCDDTLGDVGLATMNDFQKKKGLQVGGGCGPDTRRFLKDRYGIDLEEVAKYLGGTNHLVQLDGTTVVSSANFTTDVSEGT